MMNNAARNYYQYLPAREKSTEEIKPTNTLTALQILERMAREQELDEIIAEPTLLMEIPPEVRQTTSTLRPVRSEVRQTTSSLRPVRSEMRQTTSSLPPIPIRRLNKARPVRLVKDGERPPVRISPPYITHHQAVYHISATSLLHEAVCEHISKHNRKIPEQLYVNAQVRRRHNQEQRLLFGNDGTPNMFRFLFGSTIVSIPLFLDEELGIRLDDASCTAYTSK